MPSSSASHDSPPDPIDWAEVLTRPGALAPGLRALGGDSEVEAVHQTHLSVVLVTKTHAVKVKKQAKFWGLVDQSSTTRRTRACHLEVELNRRLAPTLYVAVLPIVRAQIEGTMTYTLSVETDAVGSADVVEHAVVMHRLPTGATLAERLAAGEDVRPWIEGVATRLAGFHDAVRLDEPPPDIAASFAAILRGNFDGTPVDDNEVLPAALHRVVRARMLTEAEALAPLMRERAAAGAVVNGHGDVRLDHVAVVYGEVLVLDCVEFSEDLRHIDPLSDAAFLGMDLRAKGHPELARHFWSTYLATAGLGAEATSRLRALFEAYRAYVRATVDYHTTCDANVPADLRSQKASAAVRYLVQAWATLRRGRTPPVILLRGKSGSGKSVLASALAPVLDAEVIRSDVLRKALAGLGPTDRVDGPAKARLYGPEMGARTYDALWDHATQALEAGRPAILDATWLRADARALVQTRAAEAGAPLVILDVTCDREEVRRRLKVRAAANNDASDADWAVFEMQERDEEPLTQVELRSTVPYDSPGPIAPALAALAERIEQIA